MINDNYEQMIYKLAKFVYNYRADSRLSALQQGRDFEKQLYSVIDKMADITKLSESGRFDLGIDAKTLSGLNHELDGTVTDGKNIYIFELKHYFSGEVSKDMLLIFNQKIWDFAFYWLQRVQEVHFSPIFLTQCQNIRSDLRIFCYLWGITLIDRELLHPVVLKRTLDQRENKKELIVSDQIKEELSSLLEAQRNTFDEKISVWNPGTITIEFGNEPYERASSFVQLHRKLHNIIRGNIR